jgi:hypothetical protein
MAKKYKYEGAHHWLSLKITELESAGNVKELASLLRAVSDKLTPDDLQDVFQKDMTDDGFFENISVNDATTEKFFRAMISDNRDMTLGEMADFLDEATDHDIHSILGEVKTTLGQSRQVADINAEVGRLCNHHSDGTRLSLLID